MRIDCYDYRITVTAVSARESRESQRAPTKRAPTKRTVFPLPPSSILRHPRPQLSCPRIDRCTGFFFNLFRQQLQSYSRSIDQSTVFIVNSFQQQQLQNLKGQSQLARGQPFRRTRCKMRAEQCRPESIAGRWLCVQSAHDPPRFPINRKRKACAVDFSVINSLAINSMSRDSQQARLPSTPRACACACTLTDRQNLPSPSTLMSST